jgi:ribokinase
MERISGRPTVLVVGDANPDLVLTGDVVPRFGQQEQLLDRADLVLGGSAAITASGLARLGVPVALASWVGDDVFGRDVLDRLTARGVDVSLVRTHPGESTGLTVVLNVEGDRAVLTRPGTIGVLSADDITDDDLVGVRHLHVASLFLQPLLAEGLSGLLRRARDHGATTSLDTNWDPSGRWQGLADVLPLVDILLPNSAELLALATVAAQGSRPPDLESAAAELTRSGATVVLKDGADGGRVWTPEGHWSVPGLRVSVVDAVGAGDSFDAGYLAGRLAGLAPEQALRWAVGCGSLSVRAAGGTAAQPTRAELEQALL